MEAASELRCVLWRQLASYAETHCVCLCSLAPPPEDRELVREVLEELPQHEEDYLDLTLEEESQLIATIRNYLGGSGSGSGGGRVGATGGGGAAHSQ